MSAPVSIADALTEVVDRATQGDGGDRAEVWAVIAQWAAFMASHEAARTRREAAQ